MRGKKTRGEGWERRGEGEVEGREWALRSSLFVLRECHMPVAEIRLRCRSSINTRTGACFVRGPVCRPSPHATAKNLHSIFDDYRGCSGPSFSVWKTIVVDGNVGMLCLRDDIITADFDIMTVDDALDTVVVMSVVDNDDMIGSG